MLAWESGRRIGRTADCALAQVGLQIQKPNIRLSHASWIAESQLSGTVTGLRVTCCDELRMYDHDQLTCQAYVTAFLVQLLRAHR